MSDASGRREKSRPRSFRPYPEYRDAGVEWLGEIPAHWDSKPVKAALVQNDGGVWGDDFDEEGTIVLRSTEQTMQGGWRIEEPARRRLTPREATYAKLRVGDLLVTKSSGSAHHIGKTSLVDEQIAALDCCYSNFMQRLRVSDEHKARFVWYFMNCPVAREQLVFLSSTTTGLGNLSGSILGAVRVPIAPRDEQSMIAAFLDRETAKIDALVAKKQRLIELLQEKRTALITRAVTRGLDPNVPMKDSGVEWLGQIPAHWDVVRLQVTAQLGSGESPVYSADQEEAEIAMLGANGQIGWTARANVDRGLAVGRVGSSGSLHRIREPAWLSDNVLFIRPSERSWQDSFLYWVLTQADLPGLASQTAQPLLTQAALGRIKLPLLPLDEQRMIAAFLDREIESIDALVAKIREAIGFLAEFRTALISAAVTGKIDVRKKAA